MTKYNLEEFSTWLQLNYQDYWDGFIKGYEHDINFLEWVAEKQVCWENLCSLEWLNRKESEIAGFYLPDSTKYEIEAMTEANSRKVLEMIERYKREKIENELIEKLSLIKTKLSAWTKLLTKTNL